jgi:hypothetical protein
VDRTGRIREFFAAYRVDCLLALAAIIVLGPIVARGTAQSASRAALTASLVEHRSIDIDRYPLGIDYSVHDGKLRSDKAPGQSVLAAPVYAIERAVGAESVEVSRASQNLTLWWLTFWSATLPFAVLIVLLRRSAARIAPDRAVPITIGFAAGTFMIVYAVNLFGHVLGATLVFGAWYLVDRRGVSPARLVAAGALVGLAILVEYEAAVVALVMLLVLAARHRRDIWMFVAGAAPGVCALALYHWVSFGAPWKLPYDAYIGKLNNTADMGTRLPFEPAVELLLSPIRGVIITSPIVIVAVFAAILIVRQRAHPVRDHALVALGSLAGLVLLVASFAGSDVAEIPGPRFLLTALPFFVTPLVAMWDRVAVAGRAAIAWGIMMNVFATWTYLLVPTNMPLWRAYPPRLTHAEFNPTLWSMRFGSVGAVLYVASIVAIGIALGRAARDDEHNRTAVLVPEPA